MEGCHRILQLWYCCWTGDWSSWHSDGRGSVCMRQTGGWCTTDSWSSKRALQREGMFCSWNLMLEMKMEKWENYFKFWQPAAYQMLWCHNQKMAVINTVCYCSSIEQLPALGPSLINSLPPDIPNPSLSPPAAYIQQQWEVPPLMMSHLSRGLLTGLLPWNLPSSTF